MKEIKKVNRKKLYMIGNSHIDPVWFWDWDEGMQEVKATFSSALDRMKEYPDMTFTATSTAFLEWVEQVVPEMFQEIKERAAEGRFLITGGWFIEPDCILPCGEAFVRQGLYGQRYLKEKFGLTCRTGSNVDSFGHNPVLPQILKKSGMKEYIFMRPRLETPVFYWESADGSRVNAVSLPSEYTTWFYDSAKEAILMAAKAADKAGLQGMPCCFGVGNHGGGPTKKNIESIYALQKELPEIELEFSNYSAFFDEMPEEDKAKLPTRWDFFDKINTGCYSVDSEFKYKNRQTEKRLMMTDIMLSMEQCFGGKVQNKKPEMQMLWKTLLFNQFHDTLGGTAAKSARDEALMQLSGVCAESKKIWAVCMQNIANETDTGGQGFPLFLFNPSGQEYEGPIEAEVNWFCKDDLILLNEKGEEVPYQRTYTHAKVRNYNLGGRRSIVFWAHLPAAGFLVYRTVIGEPKLSCDIRRQPEFPLSINMGMEEEADPYTLENELICVQFSKSGFLQSVFDKETGYEALSGEAGFPIWVDERDTWGGRQEKCFEDSGKRMQFESLEVVESGKLRKVVRARYQHGGSRLSQLYILYHNGNALEIKSRLFWDKEWRMLKFAYPLGEQNKKVISECAYGTVTREITDGDEYSMQRFADTEDGNGAGLCVSNDGKYIYGLAEGVFSFPVARSAIYAQGSGKNWYNPLEGYEYTDQGIQEFTFLLRPHGTKIAMKERYHMAQLAEKNYLYLADSIHKGSIQKREFNLVKCNETNVEITAVKQAEEGEALIVRLLETEGMDTVGKIIADGEEYPFTIGHYEILSLKIYLQIKNVKEGHLPAEIFNGSNAEEVNLLEWQQNGDFYG